MNGNLILSRRVGETCVVGGSVTLMVLDVRGDKVWLGIDAPKDVPVDRLEVHEAKQREAGQ